MSISFSSSMNIKTSMRPRKNFWSKLRGRPKGKLIVGDDDQVLYDTLKSGKASLIRAIYADHDVVNAMLPFCERCDFHITCAADHFIKRKPDPDTIKKVLLPIASGRESAKGASRCLRDAYNCSRLHSRLYRDATRRQIEKRKKISAKGGTKDAYLLILSPSKDLNFYRAKGAREALFNLIKPYSERSREYSDEYYMVLNYYALAKFPTNNFTFRKVLHHEGRQENVAPLLKTCSERKLHFRPWTIDTNKFAMTKAGAVRDILDADLPVADKMKASPR